MRVKLFSLTKLWEVWQEKSIKQDIFIEEVQKSQERFAEVDRGKVQAISRDIVLLQIRQTANR
jgi:hypothetical protein